MTARPETGGRVETVVFRSRPSKARAAAAARLAGPAPSRAAAQTPGRSFQASRRPDSAPRHSGMEGLVALSAALAPPLRRPSTRPEPRPRHLEVVEPGALTPAQIRRRGRFFLVTIIVGVASIAFALVYLHVLLAQRQFAIDKLNSKIQSQQQSYQELRLQVAELGSPQHIISMAEGQLGMQQPASVQYVTAPSSATGTSSSDIYGLGSRLGVPTQAPAGDADWPTVKSSLAGMP